MNVSPIPSTPTAEGGTPAASRHGKGDSQSWTSLAAQLTALSDAGTESASATAGMPASAKDSAGDVRALLHGKAFAPVLPESADGKAFDGVTGSSSPAVPATDLATGANGVATVVPVAIPVITLPEALGQAMSSTTAVAASPTKSPSAMLGAVPAVRPVPLQPPTLPKDTAEGSDATALPAIATAAAAAAPALLTATATIKDAALSPSPAKPAALTASVPTSPAEPGPVEEEVRGEETAAIPAAEVAAPSELAFAVRLRDPGGADTAVPAASAETGRVPVSSARLGVVVVSGPSTGTDRQQPDSGSSSANSSFSGSSYSSSSGHSSAESVETRSPAASANPVSAAAQAAPHTAPAVSPAVAPAQPADSRAVAAEAPPASVRATLATSPQPAAEEAAAQPVHELSIRIGDGASRSADLHISDRAGEVKIVVRASDSDLSTNLRDGLADLRSQLDRHSVSSDIWQPTVASSRSTDQQPQGQSDNRNGSQGGQSGQSGSDTGGGQTPRRQRQNTPEWLDEMETSLGTSTKR